MNGLSWCYLSECQDSFKWENYILEDVKGDDEQVHCTVKELHHNSDLSYKKLSYKKCDILRKCYPM